MVAYFLLEAQPANSRGYKFSPIKTNRNSKENSHFKLNPSIGIVTHRQSTKKILSMGLIKNSAEFPEVGVVLSFVNSLTASAKG